MGLCIWKCLAAPQTPDFGKMGKVVIETKKCILIPLKGVPSFISLKIEKSISILLTHPV